MTIEGKVHCFFEQSGTFKREFIKLGIPAEDYDIQDNFGQTDHTDDLFKAIEDAYEGKPSIFDTITKDDLIMAFFPCIYFCNYAEFNQRDNPAIKNRPIDEVWKWKLEYSRKRQYFYELALKMTAIVEIRGLRMIVENPWHEVNYTNHFWFNKPAFIDYDRRTRGDYMRKPTAYWFINCTPTSGETYFSQPDSSLKVITKYKRGRGNTVKGSNKAGLCSEDRSMISPDYARNFICDFILGKDQIGSQLNLFETKN